MIFQIHPKHGRHIANTNIEAEANIENGWQTVSEEEFYGKTEDVPRETNDIPELSREDLVELYELKFGKKPHHKKSDAKIKAELEDGS
jgi:hypothetical protein